MGKAKKRPVRRRPTAKKRKSSSKRNKTPRALGYSKGNRGRRVTLSWAVQRYLSKMKKAGL